MIYILSDVYREFRRLRVRTGRNDDLAYLFAFPNFIVPWPVQPNIDFKGLSRFGRKKHVKSRFITLSGSLKCFQSFFILVKPTKTKIFIPNDMAIFHPRNRHMVIPYIPRVLHGTDIGKITSIARRVILIRIQTIHVKTFRGHFCSSILPTLTVFGGPNMVNSIWIVSPDPDRPPLGYRFFVPIYGYSSYHCLTCK